MKILVVGGGGREHAICHKLKTDDPSINLICAPGNAGIATIAKTFDISAEDVAAQVKLAKDERVDLAVIGPEVPLALGMVDEMEKFGISVFGPNRSCARLEASKGFTKSFLARHDIPTAKYKEYTDIEQIKKDIGIFGYPMVIKADGLAAGKGVVIAENESQAKTAIDDMMSTKIFGEAGDKVVVEEYLSGIEASILCFVDKSAIIPMETAQDYKRIGDKDTGPNTGGMGTYSPSLVIDEQMMDTITKEILTPTFEGFKSDGLDFRGVLFIGIMLTDEGPKVIEFNNRFGDPETQSILPRLKTPLLDIFLATTEDRLYETEIEWFDYCTVSVVMAAGGYPGSYKKGDEIYGLENFPIHLGFSSSNLSYVFHAGTKISGAKVVTAGGRVLCVSACAKTHEEARALAYDGVSKISFEGATFRKDIGIVTTR